MLVDNPMKFHHGILNDFQVTEQVGANRLFPISKGHNLKNMLPSVTVLVFAPF